jgi:hypothetical protein
MAKLANDRTPARSGKGISYVTPTLLSYPFIEIDLTKIFDCLKKEKKPRRRSDGKTSNT